VGSGTSQVVTGKGISGCKKNQGEEAERWWKKLSPVLRKVPTADLEVARHRKEKTNGKGQGEKKICSEKLRGRRIR